MDNNNLPVNNNERVVLRPRRRNQVNGNNQENINNPVNDNDDNPRTDDESNDSISDCGTLSHSFECGICSQTFKTEGEVKRHRQQHNWEGSDSEQNEGHGRYSPTWVVNRPQDDASHSSDSDSDSSPLTVTLYECRLCGVRIPEDQRRAHRAIHPNFRARPHLRN